jgi:hypothetical protein
MSHPTLCEGTGEMKRLSIRLKPKTLYPKADLNHHDTGEATNRRSRGRHFRVEMPGGGIGGVNATGLR